MLAWLEWLECLRNCMLNWSYIAWSYDGLSWVEPLNSTYRWVVCCNHAVKLGGAHPWVSPARTSNPVEIASRQATTDAFSDITQDWNEFSAATLVIDIFRSLSSQGWVVHYVILLETSGPKQSSPDSSWLKVITGKVWFHDFYPADGKGSKIWNCIIRHAWSQANHINLLTGPGDLYQP